MKKHEITVRHIREAHPQISTSAPQRPEEVARRLFYDADEHGWAEVISITVDGEEFFTLEDTKIARLHC